MMRFICIALDRMCCLVHPFWRIEVFFTSRHCNLSDLSLWLNDKYDLGVWRKEWCLQHGYPEPCAKCNGMTQKQWDEFFESLAEAVNDD